MAGEPDENELLDGELPIRAKWIIDGAATLGEAAQRAEEFAARLRELAGRGFELRAPVEDDWGWAVPGQPAGEPDENELLDGEHEPGSIIRIGVDEGETAELRTACGHSFATCHTNRCFRTPATATLQADLMLVLPRVERQITLTWEERSAITRLRASVDSYYGQETGDGPVPEDPVPRVIRLLREIYGTASRPYKATGKFAYITALSYEALEMLGEDPDQAGEQETGT